MTAFTRVIKSGITRAWRNRMVSIATVGVLVLTLFIISGLLLFNVVTNVVAQELQNKVDISAYFYTKTPEEKILDVRKELTKRPEVKSVEYISRDQALTAFKETYKNDEVIQKSLEEIGENPLEASLNIKVIEASQYAGVVAFLESNPFKGLIDKINYNQKEAIIMKLDSITRSIKKGGVILSLILAVIAVLVTFNTIRLTMYTAKEEVGIMRLVGASNWFIRGPFIIEGIIYGLIAAIASLGILYPLIRFASPKLDYFLPGTDFLSYFQGNLLTIFLIQVGLGVFLGIVSSLVAIRKYLKV